MRGIEISERYFRTCGEPLLRERFPDLWPRMAVGVCGPGSENFGFDDVLSRDHDFDPGFYIWLSAEDYKTWEFRVSRAYDSLPEEFLGVAVIGKSAYGTARHGVRERGEFFRSLTGFTGAPPSNEAWLSVPQHRLANAVNGRIFYDGAGEVTALRAALAAMPEDVRRKKLAKHVIFAAQAGQYNYTRALAHGQAGAAALALARFAENYVQAAFLLDRRYCPFYKWMLRAGRELETLGPETARLDALLAAPGAPGAAQEIEALSRRMIEALRQQGLTDHPSEFLEPHAYEIMARISDPALRALHVME